MGRHHAPTAIRPSRRLALFRELRDQFLVSIATGAAVAYAVVALAVL